MFSLAVHVVAVTVWVGGLLVLAAVARPLGDRLGAVATRYSGLAWSFGEIATLLVMVALAVQWFRGDQREGRARRP